MFKLQYAKYYLISTMFPALFNTFWFSLFTKLIFRKKVCMMWEILTMENSILIFTLDGKSKQKFFWFHNVGKIFLCKFSIINLEYLLQELVLRFCCFFYNFKIQTFLSRVTPFPIVWKLIVFNWTNFPTTFSMDSFRRNMLEHLLEN
jgi:hypothetical protein